jgi:hypothetical protein
MVCIDTSRQKWSFWTSHPWAKWCEFHKIPWKNIVECCSKKSSLAEVKSYESDVGSDSESEPEKGTQIIDAKPSATVATTKVYPGEPDEPEEGESASFIHRCG